MRSLKVLEFDFEIRVETLLLVAFQLLFKVDSLILLTFVFVVLFLFFNA